MSGIGVITNPRSRQNRRDPRLAGRLGYILGEKGPLEQPSDLDELETTARRFLEREIEIVCINGGDGTIHRAVSAMMRVYDGRPLPRLALLRGGTMNTVASGLKIRLKAADMLEQVVSRYHADAPMGTVRRWTMEVDRTHYGFLFGNGLLSRFLEIYYEGSEPSPTKAACLLLRAAASAVVGGKLIRRLTDGYRGTVDADGVRWPLEQWLTVAIGTVDDLGLGFRPFYKAPLHPGRMHALGIACSPAALAFELPRVYRARPIEAEGVHDQVCEQVVLRAEAGPMGFMMDGDFHRGGQTVTVRMGPPVDFIVPEP